MFKRSNKFDLKYISESRTILLGVAILIVAIHHSYSLNFSNLINITPISNILNFIQKIGDFGVDIFLFLSGIGLYFSLSKNNLKTFYKNRFTRILPELILITLIFNIITKSMTIPEFLERIFFIGFFIKGKKADWFLAFIMLLYLIFPLIYKIIKKYNLDGLIISLFTVVLFNLIYSVVFPLSYNKIEIALTRIPIFLFGVFFGKKIYEKTKISSTMIIISILTQILVTLILYQNQYLGNFRIFTRYLYCPLAITTIINLSFIYSILKNKDRLIIKLLKLLGPYSLEVYLIYEKSNLLLKNILPIKSSIIYYSISFTLTILLAHILKKLINIIMNKISILKPKIITNE